MELRELLEPFLLKRAAACAIMGLALFALIWQYCCGRRAALTLAGAGAAWAGCHVVLSLLSGIFPPREPADWLVFGGLALTAVAALAAFRSVPPWLLAVAAALMLAAAFWQMAGKIPWLLSAEESPEDRLRWMLAGAGALLLVFAAAEWLARGLSPAAALSALGVLAVVSAAALWKLGVPPRMIHLTLLTGSMAGGAAAAALFQRGRAVLPPGWAGWFAGGVFVLFVRAALSRADGVPLVPMGAAAAVVPAAALIIAGWRRLAGYAGLAPAAIAAVLLAGAGLFWTAAEDHRRRLAAPPAPEATGADDTGAYEGL